jgi:hypothetical protein
MGTEIEAGILRKFVEDWGKVGVESTHAKVVDFDGVLYNVDGSSDDPHIDNKTWVTLLTSYGISGNCYVTNSSGSGAAPSGSTHPAFNVGGHMTTNSSGAVATGGTCYLMPLCSWHNSKARDGVAFSHTQEKMLLLSGYMQGELAATFLARMPGDEAYSLVYLTADHVGTQKISTGQRATLASTHLEGLDRPGLPEHYVLFKRIEKDGRSIYVVEESNLPG